VKQKSADLAGVRLGENRKGDFQSALSGTEASDKPLAISWRGQAVGSPDESLHSTLFISNRRP
jgi:hypothetical protein